MFKTTGKMNRQFYLDNYYALAKRRCVFGLIYGAILTAICIAYFFIFDDLFLRVLAVLCGVLGVFIIIRTFFLDKKRFADFQERRFLELYQKSDIDAETFFEDDGIHRKTDYGDVLIKYENVKSVVLYKNSILLKTAARFFIPVYADQLSDDEINGLIVFLKEKGVKKFSKNSFKRNVKI